MRVYIENYIDDLFSDLPSQELINRRQALKNTLLRHIYQNDMFKKLTQYGGGVIIRPDIFTQKLYAIYKAKGKKGRSKFFSLERIRNFYERRFDNFQERRFTINGGVGEAFRYKSIHGAELLVHDGVQRFSSQTP